MLRDLAIVLMAAGATLIATGGSLALIRWMRRRPCADVLDMIEHAPPRSVVPLRCICAARRSYCDCAIDGVRNPRGAGRARAARFAQAWAGVEPDQQWPRS
jgi:hypothetical protein